MCFICSVVSRFLVIFSTIEIWENGRKNLNFYRRHWTSGPKVLYTIYICTWDIMLGSGFSHKDRDKITKNYLIWPLYKTPGPALAGIWHPFFWNGKNFSPMWLFDFCVKWTTLTNLCSIEIIYIFSQKKFTVELV